MREVIDCPGCRRKLQARETIRGKLVQCPSCGRTFSVPADDGPPVPVPAPALRIPTAREDESWPSPPRRPAAGLADANDAPIVRLAEEPHHGPLILSLGLLALIFSFCPLLGWLLGGIALGMGNGDLQRMRSHRMDLRGRSQTEIGMICGGIGMFLGMLFCMNGTWLHWLR